MSINGIEKICIQDCIVKIDQVFVSLKSFAFQLLHIISHKKISQNVNPIILTQIEIQDYFHASLVQLGKNVLSYKVT